MNDQQNRTFRAWLLSYAQIHGALGDLARTVLDDPEWPEGPVDLERCRERLVARGADTGAVDTLEEAWERYSHVR
ncbi:YozE family protein [Streptacidiphilus sp. ASG 303]|uniref:YozE family protein n=1 Tax=Streptomycetaceae TaxID=2062 RepID=UPI001E4EF504|nr:YozE family protein [Streptacidiphilus sp. ASG 303]MCD0480912.1 YozE family protein [Streptacidiphilus sp. ASG 303]